MLKTKTIASRDISIDFLRLFSIYIILLIHSSGGYLIYNGFDNGFDWWIIGVIYAGFIKWGSAVFIMISGLFMLKEKRSIDIGHFLKGRFVRIVIPFIAWAIFYKFLQNPQEFIQSKGLVLGQYFLDIIRGNVEYHLWFVYMISVLYLLTPFLSYMVNHAPKKIIYYFLSIWFLMNFIPTHLEQFFNLGFGLNPYLEFAKYSGFYVLGFVLKDVIIKKPWRLLIIFILLSVINIIGTHYLSIHNNTNDYFLLSRFSITNIANAIIIFLFFHSFKDKLQEKANSPILQWMSKLSILSYGIYLNHVFILSILRSGDYGFIINAHYALGKYIEPAYGVLLVFLLTAIGSTVLALILDKIPYLRKIAN